MQLMKRPTLDEILVTARGRAAALVPRRAELERAAAAAPPARPFAVPSDGSVGVVAEIKRRSPSAGEIHSDLDAVSHARAYAAGGAAAISVLTDEQYFGGSLDDLRCVAQAVSLPVLRKDFILDELQLLEARAAGASIVLLIVRALPDAALRALTVAARGLGLATLVEAHDEAELERALAVESAAVGINSRDLRSYAVDLATAERLVRLVPGGVVAVAESGVETRGDVERMAAAGADFVLVGTALAKQPDPLTSVAALAGVRGRGRGRS